MKTSSPRNLFRSRSRDRVCPGHRPPDAPRVRLTARDIARLKVAEKQVRRCTLCKAPAVHAPVWVAGPEESKRLGAPDGEARIVVVGLCADCRALPDAFGRVERQLYDLAAEGLSRPEAN